MTPRRRPVDTARRAGGRAEAGGAPKLTVVPVLSAQTPSAPNAQRPTLRALSAQTQTLVLDSGTPMYKDTPIYKYKKSTPKSEMTCSLTNGTSILLFV